MSGGQLSNISTIYTPAENNQIHIFYIMTSLDTNFANIGHTFSDSIRGLVHEVWAGPDANPPTPPPQGAPVTMYSADNAQQHVFYVDENQNISHVFWDPSRGRVHEVWAGTGANPPTPAPAGDPASLYSANNGQQHIFYRDAESNITHVFYDPNSGMHNETWVFGVPGNPATMYTPAEHNQQHIFYVDANHNIAHTFWDSGRGLVHEVWAGPGAALQTLAPAGDPATLYTANNGQQHVFYWDYEGIIVHAFWDPASGRHWEYWASLGG